MFLEAASIALTLAIRSCENKRKMIRHVWALNRAKACDCKNLHERVSLCSSHTEYLDSCSSDINSP